MTLPWLAVRKETWLMLKSTAADDHVQLVLRAVVIRSWPDSNIGCPIEHGPYFYSRDELAVQDELVFKGPQLIVPLAPRRNLWKGLALLTSELKAT